MKRASLTGAAGKLASDRWRHDLLADLLRSIRLRSADFSAMELDAPWGFSLSAGGAAFHIIARGTCWLEVAGAVKSIQLSEGDHVILPRGDAHVIRDAPTTQVADIVNCDDPSALKGFRARGNGPHTRLICGCLRFANDATDPLLAILPPLLHFKQQTAHPAPWLATTVVKILEELESDRPGAEAVVTRLAELMFVQAVRGFFEQNADRVPSGWLAAVRDKHIGRALALMHAEPERAWTISSLADRVALSRSVLAAKFSQLVGEPPLRYLTRLRLNSAVLRLRSTEDGLKTIAAAAGYESVAAFAKAFKRHMGMTPGAYRKNRGPP
jgi:AraC-like DNA-binding protein